MSLTAQMTKRWLASAIALAAASVLMAGQVYALQVTASKAVTPQASSAGTVLDRVIAVVNEDVILESDVDEERRFEEIQPFRTAADSTREKILERLIDRALILQPEDAVPDKDLDAQIATLRKDLPQCNQYHCETDEGWAKFLGEHGFTVGEFRDRWRKRMELLKFIEVRFRNGITISDDQIKAYYEKSMLPEYAKRKTTAPA